MKKSINIKASLYVIAGFLASTGNIIAVKFRGESIAIVNIVYITILIYNLFINRSITLNKEKIILLSFFSLWMISAIVTYLLHQAPIEKEAMMKAINAIVPICGLVIFTDNDKMCENYHMFIKGFYVCGICQMLWSWLERICFMFNFYLNNFVYGQVLKITTSHALTTVKKGVLRPSGFSWEPANLALVLVICYTLSSNKVLKFLFAISTIMVTSMTGIVMLGAVVSVELLYYVKNKQFKVNKKIIFGAIIVVFILLLLFLFGNSTKRVLLIVYRRAINIITGKLENDSSSVRHIEYYPLGIKLICKNIIRFFFGYGTFMAGYTFSTRTHINTWYSKKLWNPETDFVTLLVGNGILGVVLYYYFIFRLLKRKREENKRRDLYTIIAILSGGITYLYITNKWPLLILAMMCYSEDRFENNNLILKGFEY